MAQGDAAAAYMAEALARLANLARDELPAIRAAAALCHAAVRAGGQVHLFGTGHSHMLAEEGHFRAGGLAPVCPVLASPLMLHEAAASSTRLERMAGVAPVVLERYGLGPADVLVVFSNSGVNAVPVEAALFAKGLGAKVVAVVSRAYAAAAPLGPTGKRLAEVADVAIDNHGVPGDALLEVGGARTGPLSTAAGALILNAVLAETVALLASDGGPPPPVYVSANMPGASEHNARLVALHRPRNPHL